MKLKFRIKIWFLSIVSIIGLTFLLQVLVFSGTNFSSDYEYFSLNLLFLTLFWAIPFFSIFNVKYINMNKELNINSVIFSLFFSLLFGFLLAVNLNFLVFESAITKTTIIILVSLFISILYTYVSLEFYVRRNKKIKKLDKYSRLSKSIYLKLFFTNWDFYDEIVFKDDIDFNNPLSFIISSNYIFLITVPENSVKNPILNFTDSKNNKDNKFVYEVKTREEKFRNFLKKVEIENEDKILQNLIIYGNDQEIPLIYGKRPDNFVITSLKNFNEIVGGVDLLGNESLFSDKDYLTSVIKEDWV